MTPAEVAADLANSDLIGAIKRLTRALVDEAAAYERLRLTLARKQYQAAREQ